MKKRNDGGLIWVEAVQNVEIAKNRIDNFGKTAPGEYVIFYQAHNRSWPVLWPTR
jgi:hypothetical protein